MGGGLWKLRARLSPDPREAVKTATLAAHYEHRELVVEAETPTVA